MYNAVLRWDREQNHTKDSTKTTNLLPVAIGHIFYHNSFEREPQIEIYELNIYFLISR